MVELRSQHAVTDQNEANVRRSIDNSTSRFDEKLVPFEVKQSRHFGDSNVLWLQAELLPNFDSAARRIQEWVNVHPAVDRCEFISRCNACRNVLFCQRVADADKGVGSTSRPAFEGSINVEGQARLTAVKLRAVNGVDGWNFRFGGGVTPDDPGF